ncbi:MAG: hypothetical protein AAB460_00495 [Patescibacteria group bacterium]
MRKIKLIAPDPIPLISLTWSEGRIFDLWMIVHTLSGMALACGIWLLPLPTTFDYPLVLVLLIAWEIYEIAAGLTEEVENLTLDIVFGLIGFSFVYEKMLTDASTGYAWAIGVAFLACNALLNFLGWRAYRKRGK